MHCGSGNSTTVHAELIDVKSVFARSSARVHGNKFNELCPASDFVSSGEERFSGKI